MANFEDVLRRMPAPAILMVLIFYGADALKKSANKALQRTDAAERTYGRKYGGDDRTRTGDLLRDRQFTLVGVSGCRWV